MRFLSLALLCLALTGCPAPTVPAPPLPEEAACLTLAQAVIPTVQVYTDASGRDFCYDAAKFPGDPTQIPLAWDKALNAIRVARPLAKVDDLVTRNATVTVFLATDGINESNHLPYFYGDSMLYSSELFRAQENLYFALTFGQPLSTLLGLTDVETYPPGPALVYVTGEVPCALPHEYERDLWFHLFTRDVAPDGIPVWNHIGDESAYDPFFINGFETKYCLPR